MADDHLVEPLERLLRRSKPDAFQPVAWQLDNLKEDVADVNPADSVNTILGVPVADDRTLKGWAVRRHIYHGLHQQSDRMYKFDGLGQEESYG